MFATEIRLAPHFADARQQVESAAFGMWLFLLTEIMLFGGLFTAYVVYRWMYSESFAAGSQHLDVWLGAINTVVLIGSSLTMVLAHSAAVDRKAKGTAMFLALTLLLGSVFLGIKSVEYAHKFEEGLFPGRGFTWRHSELEQADTGASDAPPEHVEMFFSLYFLMTGLHALHMLLGLGMLILLIVLAMCGKHLATTVEMTGLYWHFVDVIWIFLFPLLYLIGRHG